MTPTPRRYRMPWHILTIFKQQAPNTFIQKKPVVTCSRFLYYTMIPLYSGILIFLGCTFLAGKILNSATAHLNEEQKAGLITLFSKQRLINLAVMVVLITGFFILMNQKIDQRLVLSIYFGALVVFLAYSTRASQQLLVKNEYPEAYIRAFVWSTVLRYTGLGLMMVALLMFKN
jgi:ABC-type multidrug transport system fused ATPase/permease subunit